MKYWVDRDKHAYVSNKIYHQNWFWDSLSIINIVLKSAWDRFLESLLQCQWSTCTTAWHRLCNICRIHFAGGVANLPKIWARCVGNWLLLYNIYPTGTLWWFHYHRFGSHVLASRSVDCKYIFFYYFCKTSLEYHPLIRGQSLILTQNREQRWSLDTVHHN